MYHVLEHFAFMHSLEDLKKENDSYKEQVSKHDFEKAELMDSASTTKAQFEQEKEDAAEGWKVEKDKLKKQFAQKFQQQTKSWANRLAAETKTWEDKLAEVHAEIAAQSAGGVWDNRSPPSASAGQHIHISQSQQLDTHSKFT